ADPADHHPSPDHPPLHEDGLRPTVHPLAAPPVATDGGPRNFGPGLAIFAEGTAPPPPAIAPISRLSTPRGRLDPMSVSYTGLCAARVPRAPTDAQNGGRGQGLPPRPPAATLRARTHADHRPGKRHPVPQPRQARKRRLAHRR